MLLRKHYRNNGLDGIRNIRKGFGNDKWPSGQLLLSDTSEYGTAWTVSWRYIKKSAAPGTYVLRPTLHKFFCSVFYRRSEGHTFRETILIFYQDTDRHSTEDSNTGVPTSIKSEIKIPKFKLNYYYVTIFACI
jgi:hypothetical protein